MRLTGISRVESDGGHHEPAIEVSINLPCRQDLARTFSHEHDLDTDIASLCYQDCPMGRTHSCFISIQMEGQTCKSSYNGIERNTTNAVSHQHATKLPTFR